MDICLQHYLFRDEEQIISKNKYMGIVLLNIEAIVFITKHILRGVKHSL